MGKEKQMGYDEKGKREFNFVYKKELIVYKKMLGFRVHKDEEKYIKKYNENCLDTEGKPIIFFENYTEWKKSIIEKYKEYEKEKLENFIFYLENGEYKDFVLSQAIIGVAAPLIIGIVLLYIENYIQQTEYQFLDPIFTIVMFMVCFWGGLKLFNEYSDSKKLYEEYGKIMTQLYDLKYGE